MDKEKTAGIRWKWKNMSHRTMTSVFNATARCSGCVSTIRGTARQAHTENGRKQIKGDWRGTVKEEAAQRRVKEELDKAVVR